MKAAVIVFPGSNCDKDLQYALQQMGVQVTPVWHGDTVADKYDLICIPGGFSYGDYLRSGSLASRSKIMEQVKDWVKQGVPVLGICNGFQILTESGLLPGALLKNKTLKHICVDVDLKGHGIFSSSDFASYRIPVSHSEGNFYCSNEELDALKANDQIFFSYHEDINGSRDNIAGIVDKTKKVFGLMPHPERAFLKTADRERRSDGRLFFETLFNNIAS